MEDVPVAGRALYCHIAKRIVPNLLAVDAADEVAVFVREVPCVAPANAVIAVVEHVDLIAVEDGIATSVDIDLLTGQPHLAAVAQVLVVLGAILRLAGGHLVVGVLEPEVVLVRHDILRGHRQACHQGEAKSKQSWFHKAMILRVKHVCLSTTNRVPKTLLLEVFSEPAAEFGYLLQGVTHEDGAFLVSLKLRRDAAHAAQVQRYSIRSGSTEGFVSIFCFMVYLHIYKLSFNISRTSSLERLR